MKTISKQASGYESAGQSTSELKEAAISIAAILNKHRVVIFIK
jgi:hypothetical protein